MMNRRQLLTRAAWSAAALGAGGVLTACGGGGSAAGPTDVLRVGAVGSPNDTLDVGSAGTNLPFLVAYNVADSLVVLRGGRPTLSLAERIDPDPTARNWTIRIRDGVRFHDGRPVTARDVVASLGYLAASATFGSTFADLDRTATAAVDARTVRVVLRRPRADLVEGVLALGSLVFPDGRAGGRSLVGSGPYRLESFAPDRGAVLVRNDGYWNGPPELPRIELRSLPDVTARTNALTTGQLDYVTELTVTAAQTVSGSGGAQVQAYGPENSQAFVFALNSTRPPFTDPEVRRAVRLAVDREQLVSVLFDQYGTVGNDMLGLALAGYNTRIPQRAPDPEAARRTLAAKGVTRLRMVVGEITPGLTDSANLFAQQMGAVGVGVDIARVDASTYFADASVTGSAQVVCMVYANRPAASSLPTFTGATNPYSFDKWSSPAYEQALADSQRLVDPVARQAALDRAQQLSWEDSGLVVWGFRQVLSGAREGLTDVAVSQTVPEFGAARYA